MNSASKKKSMGRIRDLYIGYMLDATKVQTSFLNQSQIEALSYRILHLFGFIFFLFYKWNGHQRSS